MRLLFLLFIVMPILEMWLLIQVGSVIGSLLTIGLVLLTACLGLSLLRVQSRGAIHSARQKMQRHEMPLAEMADGLFFAVGGALLLTPGFITDTVGFACLIPVVRRTIAAFLVQRLAHRHSVHPHRDSRQASEPSQVIEGEYQRHDDRA